jgi:hypothetical protein
MHMSKAEDAVNLKILTHNSWYSERNEVPKLSCQSAGVTVKMRVRDV